NNIAEAGQPLNDFDQLVRCVAGKEIAIGMSDLVELRLDRVIDFRIGVPDRVDGRASRTIKVALAIHVIEIAALAVSNLRQTFQAEAARAVANNLLVYGHHSFPP